VHLEVLALLSRVGGQADPLDLLLLLGDDIHGHEHVQGIVDTAPDVLLVISLGRRTNNLPSDPKGWTPTP
jgi:hypothetical protein